jgi:RimJ/RimL family protein N-acetyltransferase
VYDPRVNDSLDPDRARALKVLETPRLVLRRMHPDDADFILELLNDPGWIQFIGDKGVRTLDAARAYIRQGPMAMYARHGIGLYLTELKEGGVPIGMCGLIRRDSLPDVDIGFAFLPAYRQKGYALEAASATMEYGMKTLGLRRIVAITSPDNHSSIRLLEKLGMRFERLMRLPGDTEDVSLLALDA